VGKPEDQVSSGDAINLRGTKKFFELANPKMVKQRFEFEIPAGEEVSGLNVKELRSPNDRIYTLLGIDLELDMEFEFKIKDRDQFFTESDGILRYRDAPAGTPFAMFNWLFETEPIVTARAPQFAVDAIGTTNFYLIDWTVFQLEEVPPSFTVISVNK
jgi:hypothetical protein